MVGVFVGNSGAVVDEEMDKDVVEVEFDEDTEPRSAAVESECDGCT